MDSKTNSGDALEVVALGRPFNLGMLYDCRKDTLIPGMTLWDHDDLMEHVGERWQSYSDFSVEASDSSESKYSALNVNASLKASLFSGAVDVEGSAKYLNDTKISENQTSVTLNYKATTKVRELSMNHLGRHNVRHPDVFDKGLATHVVTAIVYGAQAFFVFKSEVSEKEDHKDIQGKLKVSIEKIPKCKIEGEGEAKIDETETVNKKEFSCKFYGDFCIQTPPTTFQDAIRVYQSLPGLLGSKGENAIPMKVWLLPLTSIDSSAAKLVRQISVGLVQDCQRVLEDFNEIDMRCNDAMTMAAAKQFPQIVKKLNNFKEMCSEFKLKFQQSLAKNLPSIRGGGEEESELAEILRKIHSSPFNRRNMNEWMESKESEIHTLRCFTKMMKNTAIIPSQNELYEELLNADHVVCFVFTSLGRAEPYLSALLDYLKGTTKPDDPQDPHTDYVEKEPWYASAEIAEMKKKTKLFNDFAENNKEKNIKFLTVGLRKDTRKGSTIYLYKDGFSVDENFEPPETLTVGEINHNSVTLKIFPPRFGEENVTSYSVEYCVSGEDGRQQKTESKTEEVTVSDLRLNTEYKFRCRAVTLAGVWPVSAVSDSIKTLPCCPPGEPQVEANSCDISVVWKKPADLGQDVQISSYILEYAKTDNEVKEELKWKQIRAKRESGIISGLQSETKYAVRFTNCL
ncbi:neoverrucotoxin subunit alpha-like [Embiotoca jacksoni]|uniref:neoverrucotoxin subunit alpha-like n=1 Tax=Embiotoca jacksoni TaxID=100190 RepID=UPI00370390F2